jgi:tRNA 5-methylaminomethyl-2-thiouridine biosynthesis bifunctional protein
MQIPPNIINEHYDDRYFDVVNAIKEARHIHFDGCSLIDRIKSIKGTGKPFHIGETGFGAGRILVGLMEYLDSSDLTDINVHFHSVELYPLSSERILSILDCFRETAGSNIDLLIEKYDSLDINKNGWHKFSLPRPFGTITVNIWTGEALEMVNVLDISCDAWFLDGHGPKKNPQMWRSELLNAISEKTVQNGTFSTYTVAGDVRRTLQAAGFVVEKGDGFGGKKSVMRGVMKRDDCETPKETPTST